MKGSITAFLALSLSFLTGFVLLLTGNAVGNAGKVRLEGAVDLGMNSVLGEFHTKLHERYGLLYIDTSYEGREPSIQNLESRLDFYIRQNSNKQGKGKPWGGFLLEDVKVAEIVTAAQGKGNSLKYQAVCYRQDCGKGEKIIYGTAAEEAEFFGSFDAMSEWSAIMRQIEMMELPMVLNEQNEWEEVPLRNPAEAVFSLTGSDLLYLVSSDTYEIGVGLIQPQAYISGRTIQNLASKSSKEADTRVFVEYLFDKMGNYGRMKGGSFLQYQLEYIAIGARSDYENLKGVAEQLLAWRFAENASYALPDSGLYAQALSVAEQLQAVKLKEDFKEPVARSIVYACAYLESLGEVGCLLSGGRVALEKSHWSTSVEQVLSVDIPKIGSMDAGLSYEEYLFCMIMLLSEDTRNLRSMDIMEMDIRYLTGNTKFSMDWCVERFTAKAHAKGSLGNEYFLNRTYGYY